MEEIKEISSDTDNSNVRYPIQPSALLSLPLQAVNQILENLQQHLTPTEMNEFCLSLLKTPRPGVDLDNVSLKDRCLQHNVPEKRYRMLDAQFPEFGTAFLSELSKIIGYDALQFKNIWYKLLYQKIAGKKFNLGSLNLLPFLFIVIPHSDGRYIGFWNAIINTFYPTWNEWKPGLLRMNSSRNALFKLVFESRFGDQSSVNAVTNGISRLNNELNTLKENLASAENVDEKGVIRQRISEKLTEIEKQEQILAFVKSFNENFAHLLANWKANKNIQKKQSKTMQSLWGPDIEVHVLGAKTPGGKTNLISFNIDWATNAGDIIAQFERLAKLEGALESVLSWHLEYRKKLLEDTVLQQAFHDINSARTKGQAHVPMVLQFVVDEIDSDWIGTEPDWPLQVRRNIFRPVPGSSATRSPHRKRYKGYLFDDENEFDEPDDELDESNKFRKVDHDNGSNAGDDGSNTAGPQRFDWLFDDINNESDDNASGDEFGDEPEEPEEPEEPVELIEWEEPEEPKEWEEPETVNKKRKTENVN